METFDATAVFNDDDFFTFTSTEQKRIEAECQERAAAMQRPQSHDGLDDVDPAQLSWDEFKQQIFWPLLSQIKTKIYEMISGASGDASSAKITVENMPLLREKHMPFLQKSLLELSHFYESLDASHPWLVYWTVHSLALLGQRCSDDVEERIIRFLKTCEDKDGGYAGGPGQKPHLATTYASVMALCELGSDAALASIDRQRLHAFLLRMKDADGGYRMEQSGECDVRGLYCALSTAAITNTLTRELVADADSWIVSCQTYEGGFAGARGCEAHGGYTFCALAAMVILGRTTLIDLDALLRWLAFKQMRYEGGFQGRTNKLVDGCYSFWQGACFPLIQEIHAQKHPDAPVEWLFNNRALQEYVLFCCQSVHGGLCDKPSKSRDLYHTCYCLSGLSIAQHLLEKRSEVVGDQANVLLPTHPVYNVTVESVTKTNAFFSEPLVKPK